MEETKNTTTPVEEQNVVTPVTDEQTGSDVVEEKAEPKAEEPKDDAPKLKTNPNGTFHGLFLSPINHLGRIRKYLTEEAEHDEELAKAIAEGKETGKKTIEGCNRYILNNMKDLMREMHEQGIQFDDDSIHLIAKWYMINPDVQDVQNVTKAVNAIKTEPKPKEKKKETKPKATKKAEPKKEEKKEPKVEKKPKAKTVPLTPQMGDLFGDFDFGNNNNDNKEK